LQRILVARVANFAPDFQSNLLLHLILKVCKVPAVKTCGLKPAHSALVAQGDGLLNRRHGPGSVELGQQMFANTAFSYLRLRPLTITVSPSPALVTSRANGRVLDESVTLRAATCPSRVRSGSVARSVDTGTATRLMFSSYSGGFYCYVG
jgi:hypothetical protein